MSSQIPMTYDNAVYPNRRSPRLKDWDYSKPGAYFVTVVTKDRQCLFGQIEHGQMTLNDVGSIIAQTWEWLQDQYPYIELDAFVVMPNHIHGIIVLQEADDGDRIAEPAQGMKRADAADASRWHPSHRGAHRVGTLREASAQMRPPQMWTQKGLSLTNRNTRVETHHANH